MALKKLKKLYKTKQTSTPKTTTEKMQTQVNNLKTRLNAVGEDIDSRNAIQKALNLEEGTGFLGGLGDVLDRLSGGASVRAMISGDPHKTSLENALEAFTGQQRVSGRDVLLELFPETKYSSKAGQFVGGLATEILLDPTTYLTFGAGALAKGATTTGAKILGTSAKATQQALKATKTIDQAMDLARTADKANDLLKASKVFRAADALDTVANPLKLVPMAVKKTGSTAMKGIQKAAPDIADAITDLGKQAQKTFDYKKFLKQGLGDDAFKAVKEKEALADFSQELISSKTAKQQVLLEKMLKTIKKDPDYVWKITSNVDGTLADFTFKGMSDDEIMKTLKKFAINQVYFNRPTILDADMLKSLATNKGRLMLPIQDFKNPKDAKNLVKLLKEFVDDPDKVSLTKYVQPDTKIQTGYVLSIGEKNAKTFLDNLTGVSDDIVKQQDTIAKAQKKVAKAEDTLAGLQKKLDDLAKVNTSKAKKQKSLLYGNLDKVRNTTLAKAQMGVDQAVEQLSELNKRQSTVDKLLKTKELIPYEAPIINIPEMADVARLQQEAIDMNLGVRNISGISTEAIDKYTPYIHKKLTDESKTYLMTKSARNNPAVQYLVAMTDKLPSQNVASSVYGNFSPVEVNTMLGRDLFDSNLVASNLEMVKQLNRKMYNTELTKALFSGNSEWVRNIQDLSFADIDALRKQGYQNVSGLEVAKKLRLSELLGADEVNEITRSLKGQKFLISKDAIELFDKNIKLYNQLDSAFMQQLNKYMKYWKGGNLLSVGYHLRNIFGAQANMALAGMSLPDIAKYTTQAGLDMTKYNTKLLPAFSEWLLNPKNADIFKHGTSEDVYKAFAQTVGNDDARLFMELLDAQKQGVFGGIVGQHDAVKRAVGEMPTSKIGKNLDKIQDLNYKLGAIADDMNRLAAYRWAQNSDNAYQLYKVGAESAKDFVNYAMFDYKSMSPTEQAYFTKVFPFYNFVKNNLVFQFTNMTKNSSRYKDLYRAYKSLYDVQELKDEDIQQYVKDQLYIPIRLADGTVKVLKIAPPVQDATNLLSLKSILGASNPIIQYITDRAYDKDLYTGAELSGDRTQNTQQLVDLIPYGRTVRQTLSDPLSMLLPISTTSVEKANSQNLYAELEELQKIAKQYKKRTGQSLPTLEELGLK